MTTKPPLPGGRAKVYVSFQSTRNEDVLMLSATVIRRLEALGTISKRDNDGSEKQKNTRPLPTLTPPASCWITPRKRGLRTCVNGATDACKRASPVLREGVG